VSRRAGRSNLVDSSDPGPAVALAIALTVFPLIFVYARYLFWSGDWGWGPRYLVFALPALIVPVAELVDPATPPARAAALRRWRRFGLGAALLSGLAVQGLGMAFYLGRLHLDRPARAVHLARSARSAGLDDGAVPLLLLRRRAVLGRVAAPDATH
jgi:hypothetical protein